MLKNKALCFLIVISALLCFSCTPKESDLAQNFKEKGMMSQNRSDNLPFKKGETITYAIKNLGIKAGDATLTFHGITKLDGKDVILIVFRAEALNFLDEEIIYADAETFYPIFIKRELNIWGKKEKIDEYYDTDKGTIRIVKHIGAEPQEQVIEKPGKIDNIYCFIYRYRKFGKFKKGDLFTIHLPTTDVNMELVKEVKLKAAGKVFESYYMSSKPNKYQVWFDKGKQKIPFRINGSVGVSATAMTMTDYESGT